MRNKFLIVLLTFFLSSNSFAENISIVAKTSLLTKIKILQFSKMKLWLKQKIKLLASMQSTIENLVY